MFNVDIDKYYGMVNFRKNYNILSNSQSDEFQIISNEIKTIFKMKKMTLYKKNSMLCSAAVPSFVHSIMKFDIMEMQMIGLAVIFS